MHKQNSFDFISKYIELINCIKCSKEAVDKAVNKVLLDLKNKEYINALW